MSYRSITLLFCFSLLTFFSRAQGVKISPVPGQPDASAGLDVDFTDKGLLIPRLSTVQRDAIVNPSPGLMVYNLTTDCLDMFFGSSWLSVRCKCTAFPDASFALQGVPTINSPVTFIPNFNGIGTYSWSFQGGTPATSTQTSPSVQWAVPGTYNVTLVVTDDSGCTDSSTQQVTVTTCLTGGSMVFTPCGQTGETGPSQNQCNIAYGNNVVTVTGGIQYWTVPAGVCQITVTATGAKGWGNFGGRGAVASGTFAVNGGEQLKILVGQAAPSPQGSYTLQFGGGGGSFVTLTDNTPWVVAGGGGGSHMASYNTSADGSTTTAGNPGTSGSNNAAGGTNGMGGGYVSSADGGGGLLGDATGGQAGGIAFINGGNGGNYRGIGGFGAGGGTSSFNNTRSGGGGGYSGGGASHSSSGTPSGGGGGSYVNNMATNVSIVTGLGTGDGQVVISW